MIQETVGDIHLATHPTRVRIAQELSKAEKLTLSQLAIKLGKMPTEVVAFHLAILEKNGLVRSEPGLGNPADEPYIATYFKLAPKFRRVLKNAPKLI